MYRNIYIYAALIWLLIIFLLGEWGLRGTDQYWYISDLESLVNGYGKSNTVFSGSLLRGYDGNSFIHQTLILYLLTPIAKVFGSYNSWVIFNFISMFFSSVLIYKSMIKLNAGVIRAWIAFGIFLSNPITIFIIGEPLVEATQPMFISLILYFLVSIQSPLEYQNERSIIKILAVVFFILLLDLIWPIYFIVVILITLYFMYISFKSGFYIYLCSAIVFIFLYATTKIVLLSGGDIPNIEDLIMNGTVNGNNTEFWLNKSKTDFSFDPAISKMLSNIIEQFYHSDYKLFAIYSMFNILLFRSMFSIRNVFSHRKLLVIVSIALLISIAAVIVIHQNQYRYLYPVLPVVVILAMVPLNQSFKDKVFNIEHIVGVLMIVTGILSSIFIFQAKSNSIENDRMYSVSYDNISEYIPLGDDVVACWPSATAHLAYTLKGRDVVMFPSWGNSEYFKKVVDKSKTEWLLCDENFATKKSDNFIFIKQDGASVNSQRSKPDIYLFSIASKSNKD